jgi:hypothetical protein
VTIAPTAAVSEFYNTAPDETDDGGDASSSSSSAAADDASALPSAGGLRPLRAGALRDLIAEAALFGWHLAAAERRLAADPRTAPLLTPRMRDEP